MLLPKKPPLIICLLATLSGCLTAPTPPGSPSPCTTKTAYQRLLSPRSSPQILPYGKFYTTNGTSWREIIACLAVEANADLSLIQCFDEQDRARFALICRAFMAKNIAPDEDADIYLGFFSGSPSGHRGIKTRRSVVLIFF